MKTLLSCAITHRGAVCIHVAELWDGVLGVDRDDDLRAGLVPVKPTGHHFLTLQMETDCIYCYTFSVRIVWYFFFFFLNLVVQVTSLSVSIPLCPSTSHMQLQSTQLLTAFPLDGDTAEAPCRSALPTYRILLLPQVCPLGAAHLREEGVEVGRFPLAAAPVFHPAEAGKKLSRWEFANHCTALGKQENQQKETVEFTLKEGKQLLYRGYYYLIFFFFYEGK